MSSYYVYVYASLTTGATELTDCTDGFRVPKPTREADHFVASLKRSKSASGS